MTPALWFSSELPPETRAGDVPPPRLPLTDAAGREEGQAGVREEGSERREGREGGRESERVWQTIKSQYSTYFYRSQRLCSMWEPNVGVQRPKLLYLSPRGAPQKVAKALLKNERERTEGGCLSCVGRLTYASGDLASLSLFQLQTLVCDSSLSPLPTRLRCAATIARGVSLQAPVFACFFSLIISHSLIAAETFCASNATRLPLAVIERICCV